MSLLSPALTQHVKSLEAACATTEEALERASDLYARADAENYRLNQQLMAERDAANKEADRRIRDINRLTAQRSALLDFASMSKPLLREWLEHLRTQHQKLTQEEMLRAVEAGETPRQDATYAIRELITLLEAVL